MDAKLLVVDDEKNIRLLLTQCLEDAGYRVTTAVDGEHAISKVEEEGFDLVLLDMKLPGLDGLQVLRKMRTLNPGQLVIMITAHGTIETAVEAMKSGAADYLQKPFTPEEIRAIVQHNLAKKAAFQEEGRGADFDACVREARALLEQSQANQAIHFLRQAIELDPGRPEPFNLLGAASEIKGDQNAAGRMYRVALALDPSYSPANHNLDRVAQWQYDQRAGLDLGAQPVER